ncbi:MAG TPA: cytochrome ubiquinol oxidase subunit I, partial [Pseudomonadaceae bacterium]|nr:cytochrome ubiquinol oxidase subunit I [Pseudomonadaceae bacterium]
VTAFVLAVVCIGLLIKLYLLATLAALVALGLLLRWSWLNGAHPQAAPLIGNEPLEAPLHSRTRSGPGLWGTSVALMANGTLYLSLLFGWFYYWTVAPQWTVPAAAPVALLPLFGSGALLSAAALWYRYALLRLRRGDDRILRASCHGVVALGLLHSGWLLSLLLNAGLEPTVRAHDAVLCVVFGYLLLHSCLAVLLTVLQGRRVACGYVNRHLPYEPEVLWLFWAYSLGIFWTSYAAFFLLPLAWGAS